MEPNYNARSWPGFFLPNLSLIFILCILSECYFIPNIIGVLSIFPNLFLPTNGLPQQGARSLLTLYNYCMFFTSIQTIAPPAFCTGSLKLAPKLISRFKNHMFGGKRFSLNKIMLPPKAKICSRRKLVRRGRNAGGALRGPRRLLKRWKNRIGRSTRAAVVRPDSARQLVAPTGVVPIETPAWESTPKYRVQTRRALFLRTSTVSRHPIEVPS